MTRHESSHTLLTLPLAAIALATACGGPDEGAAFETTSSALFTSGNIIASAHNLIVELGPHGGPILSRTAVPYPGGTRPQSEVVRGVTFSSSGQLAVFNGTTRPYLSVYDGQTWTHRSAVNWNASSADESGALAAWGDTFFATDRTSLSSPDGGLVRFRPRLTADRPITLTEYSDVNLGLDGLLYALRGTNVAEVYDPSTMALLRRVTLSAQVRAIDGDANGDLYAAGPTGMLYRMSPAGKTIAAVQTSTVGGVRPSDNLNDLELTPSGLIVVGGRVGEVRLFDKTLAEVAPISSIGFLPVFVSIAR